MREWQQDCERPSASAAACSSIATRSDGTPRRNLRRRDCHRLGLLEIDAEPIGDGLDHEAAQGIAAGHRVDGQAHDVGFATRDGHRFGSCSRC
jgi:hypothetical protein